MPPTTPPSTVFRLASCGMYHSKASADFAMGQMRRGPVYPQCSDWVRTCVRYSRHAMAQVWVPWP